MNSSITLNKLRKDTAHCTECSNFISYIVAKTVHNVNLSDKIAICLRYIAFVERQQKFVMYVCWPCKFLFLVVPNDITYDAYMLKQFWKIAKLTTTGHEKIWAVNNPVCYLNAQKKRLDFFFLLHFGKHARTHVITFFKTDI